MAYFVVDLLRQVLMSSIISLFVGFCIDSLDDKVQSDIIVRSNMWKTILMIIFLKKTTNVIFYKK